jgi:hypothetical protein
MESISDIDKNVVNGPETVFDSYDISLNSKHNGHALKEDLVRISNAYSTLSRLASHAIMLYEQAKIRRDRVESLAWDIVWRDRQDLKSTQQKVVVRSIPVSIDGETTTITDEERRVNMYSYVCNRGKDTVRIASTNLDVGRTLLSWDKTEASKGLI